MTEIDIDELESEVTSSVGECISAVTGASDEAVAKAGETARDMLKERSPRSSKASGKGKRKKGRYADGWKCDVSGHSGDMEATVYNSAKPGLTHLLELGHAGPHPAPAKKHIEPVYRDAAEKFERMEGGA